MIYVRIIFDVQGWAYHRRALALQEYAPPDIKITIAPGTERWAEGGGMDILFDMNYGHTESVRTQIKQQNHRKLLFVSAFNNGWQARPEYFASVCRDAHAVVINNYAYWNNAGRLKGTYHISNGVDRRVFKNTVSIENRPARMLWIGSEYHRNTKNYDQLLVPLRNRLNGIAEADFRVTDPYGKTMNREQMSEWYNTGSVYVVASNVEGTPNPALEAASCGCVLVTTRVGNMPELIEDRANGIFVDHNVESLVAGVREALARRSELAANMEPKIAGWDWKTRAESYYQLFRDLVSGKAEIRRPLGWL